MMMPDVIEKKWRRHDEFSVTINDTAPWYSASPKILIKILSEKCFVLVLSSSNSLNIKIILVAQS